MRSVELDDIGPPSRPPCTHVVEKPVISNSRSSPQEDSNEWRTARSTRRPAASIAAAPVPTTRRVEAALLLQEAAVRQPLRGRRRPGARQPLVRHRLEHEPPAGPQHPRHLAQYWRVLRRREKANSVEYQAYAPASEPVLEGQRPQVPPHRREAGAARRGRAGPAPGPPPGPPSGPCGVEPRGVPAVATAQVHHRAGHRPRSAATGSPPPAPSSPRRGTAACCAGTARRRSRPRPGLHDLKASDARADQRFSAGSFAPSRRAASSSTPSSCRTRSALSPGPGAGARGRRRRWAGWRPRPPPSRGAGRRPRRPRSPARDVGEDEVTALRRVRLQARRAQPVSSRSRFSV